MSCHFYVANVMLYPGCYQMMYIDMLQHKSIQVDNKQTNSVHTRVLLNLRTVCINNICELYGINL